MSNIKNGGAGDIEEGLTIEKMFKTRNVKRKKKKDSAPQKVHGL